ncbi:MAG TPA: FAD-dependent monooxygenase, partial [Polyangiaceae bacterium]|nr:FAD-dependent monooxygenase [Polyangiaceae bacterium]
ESIGAKLEGWDYPMHFLLGDFPLAWDRPSDQAYYYAFEETFFVIVPVSAGYWRVVVKRDGPFDPAAKIEANDIRELAERYLPTGLLAGDPIWLSGAPFYMRMASSLQRGRRFLCGDAAHLFSPIGGTGMNTGMMDAFDLAWRLAYVHHGHSTAEAVLPSYGEERSEAIERGAAAADAATRLIARIERAPERIAPMLPSLRGRRLLRRVFPFQQAGLGLEYSRSSIIRGGNAAGAPRPGTMCLGLLELRRQIEVRTGKRTPLLETSVLIFVAAESLSAREVKLRAWLSDLSRFGGASLGVHIIAIGRKLPARSSATLAIDDITTLRRLGARDGAVLAIRPDGIIAFSGGLDDRQALLEHLGRWLVSASAEVTAQVPMVASNASG